MFLDLYGVAFVVRSNLTVPFSFEVQGVYSLFDEGLENIKAVFPQRPVFFKACKDYSKVSIEDYITNEERNPKEIFQGTQDKIS